MNVIQKPDEMFIGRDVRIAHNVKINVTERLVIGDRSALNEHVSIEGRDVVIGREAWLDEYAFIGGGSCFERQSTFRAGDFLHMGRFSHINTAREVRVGHECGVGVGTRICTHGAYPPQWEGFPVAFEQVTIGDRVWLPHAWVNPGVTIGSDVVVCAWSLVNRDLPSGCLACGIPVRVIRENEYPRALVEEEKQRLVHGIAQEIDMLPCETDPGIGYTDGQLVYGETRFDLDRRRIEGPGDERTERIRNQLRRHGVRFRYGIKSGRYVAWGML